ncbi:MAG: HlyD family secretion protein [Gemmatimonadota bacterium]
MTRHTRHSGLEILLLALLPLPVSCGEETAGEIQASGTVEAREADLGFQMAGRIDWIGPDAGDPLEAGAEAARLDMAELEARKRSSEATVEAARAVLQEMTAGSRPQEIAEGRAALRAAEERLEDARRDLARARRLHEGGAISQEALDKAETGARVAEAAAEQARERVDLLEEGPRQERISAQRAQVAQAQAGLAQVEAALANARITVPFDGVVTIKHREPGETVQPGAPVLTLMDPGDRWVRIYVREDRIGQVQLGQEATISSDSYLDRTYRGRVIFIADEAEFTPRNVQTTEERVKLVYAVKVRITEDPSNDLKAGIPADVILQGTERTGG